MDDFYLEFENRFRGSRESVARRLSIYLPLVNALVRTLPGGGALDLGCGRGEWLELLGEQLGPARGVDLDEAMLSACHAVGLTAEQGDALAVLRRQDSDSLALITAFHLVEHLDFTTLTDLVGEAHRVLHPGGVLLLETPNPENLTVASWSFYLDPSHLRPLPPPLLDFLAHYSGFEQRRILRLNGPERARCDAPSLTAQVLTALNAHPDYALLARKTHGTNGGADEDLLAQVAPELEADNRNLEERLAEAEWRLNQQRQELEAERQRQQIELNAAHRTTEQLREQMLERAAECGQLAGQLKELRRLATHWPEEIAALEEERADLKRCLLKQEKLRDQLQRELAPLREQAAVLAAMRRSRSWRLTAPLRRLAEIWRGGERRRED